MPQRKLKEEAKEDINKKPIETCFNFNSKYLKLDESQTKKDDEKKPKLDNKYPIDNYNAINS